VDPQVGSEGISQSSLHYWHSLPNEVVYEEAVEMASLQVTHADSGGNQRWIWFQSTRLCEGQADGKFLSRMGRFITLVGKFASRYLRLASSRYNCMALCEGNLIKAF